MGYLKMKYQQAVWRLYDIVIGDNLKREVRWDASMAESYLEHIKLVTTAMRNYEYDKDDLEHLIKEVDYCVDQVKNHLDMIQMDVGSR